MINKILMPILSRMIVLSKENSGKINLESIVILKNNF